MQLLIAPRFLLRRSAVRAISATPTKAFLATPRSISTFTPAFRTQQKWAVSAFQRRFASDDVVTKEETAAPENFAQTVAEPITEDGLTPVQQDAQAEPTNAEETVTPDVLEQAGSRTFNKDKPKFERRERADVEPSNTVYVGNLYYEVTADQIKHPNSKDLKGDPARFVIKSGHTTGTTVGRLNGFESHVRYYGVLGKFDSIEAAVYAYDNDSGAFSRGGDSGAEIAGADNEFGLQLTGGAGPTESSDVTYGTPMFWLWENVIKPEFPGANLYFDNV